jgi:DtxR family Mn-dependent transcriptional regulator
MLSAKAEEYLEAILIIESDKGYARTGDIAGFLNVKAPSVTEMVKRLDREGYVRYVKYESITLTSRGARLARMARNRHVLLKGLLTDIINVPEQIAEKDASVMEQEFDEITIEKIKEFVNSRAVVSPLSCGHSCESSPLSGTYITRPSERR